MIFSTTFSFAQSENEFDVYNESEFEDLDLEYDYKDKFAAKDPFESINRSIYGFNKAMDKAIVSPAITVYDDVIPQAISDRIHNFISNFKEPITFVNEILQGKFNNAFNTLGRFVTNSTFGMLGIHDIVSEAGHSKTRVNFTDTMREYGVAQGVYVVIPFVGPATVRKAGGMALDILANPINYSLSDNDNYVLGSINFLDARSSLKETIKHIEKSSLDEYASVRSLFLQNDK